VLACGTDAIGAQRRLLLVILREKLDGGLAQVTAVPLAALRHLDNAFGENFARAALIGRPRKCAVRLLDRLPRIVECGAHGRDGFGIEGRIRQQRNNRHAGHSSPRRHREHLFVTDAGPLSRFR